MLHVNLQKIQTLSQQVEPSEMKPHIAGQPMKKVSLWKSCIDYITINAMQHWVIRDLYILYPVYTNPTSFIRCGFGDKGDSLTSCTPLFKGYDPINTFKMKDVK